MMPAVSTHPPRSSRCRTLRWCSVVPSGLLCGLLLTAMALPPTPAQAAPDPSSFYTGEAIITGRDIPSERQRGYRMALPQVIAKVSGDSRLATHPQILAALDHAETLVRETGFVDRLAKKKLMDEQGTRERSYQMQVAFDPAAVDALIRQAGSQPWPRPRPAVRVALRITDSLGPYLLADTSSRGTGQREVLADVSRRLGLPVVLSGDGQPPLTPAILTGTMQARPEGGWTTGWTLVSATLAQPLHWDSPPGTFDRAIANGLEETARALAPHP